jgi:hypothetical protein
MLETVIATRFDRRMTNGKTKPCLMACDCEDGSEVDVVVKFSGGCERGVGGLVTEAIVAMFAADLELRGSGRCCADRAHPRRRDPRPRSPQFNRGLRLQAAASLALRLAA